MPPVLTKVKERVSGYDDYDRASMIKSKLAKVLLIVKVVLMIAIFVAFAIYDSANPSTSISVDVERSWKLPRIYIDYATVYDCSIYRIAFDEAMGVYFDDKQYVDCMWPWTKGIDQDGWGSYFSSSQWYDSGESSYKIQASASALRQIRETQIAKYSQEERNTKMKRADSYHWLFKPGGNLTAVKNDKGQIRVDILLSECGLDGIADIYYTVYDGNNADAASDNLAACGYISYISVTKRILIDESSRTLISYDLSMTGFSPYTDANGTNNAELVFIQNSEVLTTKLETPFGLFKRIITDAGGLVSVVVLIVSVVEYIVLRVLFSEAEFYYPHDLREMVLWITDPQHKRRNSTISVGTTISATSASAEVTRSPAM